MDGKQVGAEQPDVHGVERSQRMPTHDAPLTRQQIVVGQDGRHASGPSVAQALADPDAHPMLTRRNSLIGSSFSTDRCVLYVFRCARYSVSTPQPDPSLLDWGAWKTVFADAGRAVP